MKLLVITSIKEDHKSVEQILHRCEIGVFSLSATTGFKEHQTSNRPDNWFGYGGEQFDSLVAFTFTEDLKAAKALDEIRKHNATTGTGFPIRGFILPVEQTSNI